MNYHPSSSSSSNSDVNRYSFYELLLWQHLNGKGVNAGHRSQRLTTINHCYFFILNANCDKQF